MHAVWLMLSSLPVSAQVVDFRPDLSGSGTVDTPANGATIVGTDQTGTQSFSSSFSGTININATNSALAKAGSGTFTIDGATITGGEFDILDGAVAQTSGNTSVTYLSVGSSSNAFNANAPSVGSLNVSGGTITFGSALQIGDFGGTGTVNQRGGNVVFDGNGSAVSLNIGNQGGNGTYNLSGGTLSFNGTGSGSSFVVIGRNGASNVPAAQLPSTGVLNLSGDGAMIVANGSLFIGSNSSSGGVPGSGTINQTGGTLTIAPNSRLYLAAAGNGTYNLNGGTLLIGGASLNGRYNSNTGTYAFNLGGRHHPGDRFATGRHRERHACRGHGLDHRHQRHRRHLDRGTVGGRLACQGWRRHADARCGQYLCRAARCSTRGTLRVANASALGSGVLSMMPNTTLDFAQNYTLTQPIKVSGDPAINVDAGLVDTLAGPISDGSAPGDIVKTSAGTLVLSGANTYTGATTISGGTLALSGAGSIAASSGVTDNGNFDISAAGADVPIASLAGSGAVTLGARSLTLSAASDTFSGAISGSGGLTLASGHEILSGTSAYTGPTTIAGGELQVDGSLTNSTVTVARGGTLSGTGNLAGVTAGAGSTIAPAGQQVGALTVNGNFSQASNATYLVQLAPGNRSDLIAVDGTATLASGAVLDIGQPETGVYMRGARYTVLDAQGGVNGNLHARGQYRDLGLLQAVRQLRSEPRLSGGRADQSARRCRALAQSGRHQPCPRCVVGR